MLHDGHPQCAQRRERRKQLQRRECVRFGHSRDRLVQQQTRHAKNTGAQQPPHAGPLMRAAGIRRQLQKSNRTAEHVRTAEDIDERHIHHLPLLPAQEQIAHQRQHHHRQQIDGQNGPVLQIDQHAREQRRRGKCKARQHRHLQRALGVQRDERTVADGRGQNQQRKQRA